MPAQPFPVLPTSGPSVAHSPVSLVPLLTDGPAVLAPDPAAGVLAMALCQVVYRWPNAFNEIVTRQADDLFACTARDGLGAHPVPKGADFLQATLDVQFADCPHPGTPRHPDLPKPRRRRPPAAPAHAPRAYH